MDLYNIPNDDGRRYRKKVFLQMLKPDMGYIDGATDYCLLIPFAEQFKLNTEQKLWLSFLYGLTYSQTTSMQIFMRFPELNQLNEDRLNRFWEAEGCRLYFNKDKLRIRNNNQFVPAVNSLREKLIDGDTTFEEMYLQHKSFTELYKWIINRWAYFGPHGAYLFFDAIYGLLPEYYVDPTELDWKNCGKTVAQGMAHLLYLDEFSNEPIKSHNLNRYNKSVNKVQELSEQPKIVIESVLCAFKKLFKGTRYFGYYADRNLEEVYLALKQHPDFWKDNSIDLYKYREKTIPGKLRGEVQGWSGIRKENLKIWLNEGVLECRKE